MSDNKLEEYKEAITTDPDLQLLKAYTKNGWPKNKNISSLKPYTSIHDEITTAKGLIFKNSKIIVLTKLMEQVCKLIHAGNLGIEILRNKLTNKRHDQ